MVRAPFFPDKALLITRLDNLSIYYQQDNHRRQIKDTPERDRIENYESVNETYVMEDYHGVALMETLTSCRKKNTKKGLRVSMTRI